MKTEAEIRQMRESIIILGNNSEAVKALNWVLEDYTTERAIQMK